jgi:tripartite-type tricarboxylate transporter receptor subunit TctC
VWIANAPPVLPHIKSGKLRSLASTSARRPPSALDVPTLDEAGLKGYEADTWFGLFVPARTPKPILDKIHADVTEILKTKEIQDFYAQQGGEVILMTQEEFTKRVAADVTKWKALISDLKLRIE